MLEESKFSKLIKPREDEPEPEQDNICPECDSDGTDENGHLCKSCQGKGYR
jgi:DnaJ-class molecular chaperone